MRKFATIPSACCILLFVCVVAHFAQSQEQVDVAVGGGIVYSPRNTSLSESNPPVSERGGIYPSVSVNVRLKEYLGFNVESSWREKRADYNGIETYRPILTDVNGLYQRHVTRRIVLDFTAGVGLDRTQFYLPSQCTASSGTCFTSANHFMEHLGAGVQYYVWRRFFFRPEANYYHVEANHGFNSGSLLRVGASVGYTFGSK